MLISRASLGRLPHQPIQPTVTTEKLEILSHPLLQLRPKGNEPPRFAETIPKQTEPAALPRKPKESSFRNQTRHQPSDAVQRVNGEPSKPGISNTPFHPNSQ